MSVSIRKKKFSRKIFFPRKKILTQYQEYLYFEQLAWSYFMDLVNHATDWKAQNQSSESSESNNWTESTLLPSPIPLPVYLLLSLLATSRLSRLPPLLNLNGTNAQMGFNFTCDHSVAKGTKKYGGEGPPLGRYSLGGQREPGWGCSSSSVFWATSRCVSCSGPFLKVWQRSEQACLLRDQLIS